MISRGFYIIKDVFFEEANDPYLKGNKEENRPHYYCFKDEKLNYFWMIPLSSKVKKYREIIANKLKNGKRCDGIYIAKLDDSKESVFLLQDMFPIKEEYIEREYTLNGNHLILTSDRVAKEIEKKARRVIKLLRNGIKLFPTQPNIFKIIEKLEEK